MTSGKAKAAQIVAYVGASRVRMLSRIYILQPFSPTLFTQGPPKGPDLLLRKLVGDITPQEALNQWEAADNEERTRDVLKMKFLCVSCYRRKEKNYWHLPKAFGCAAAADVHTTVYRDGMWRRCLRCQDALPKLTCSVCMVTKEEDAFNAKHKKKRE